MKSREEQLTSAKQRAHICVDIGEFAYAVACLRADLDENPHRTAPGRVMYASIGSAEPDPAADWKMDPAGSLKIDANLTPPRLAWLLQALSGLVMAADTFAQKHF